MLDAITSGIAKIFGTKADKDIKAVRPYVQKIDEEFKKLTSISDDELRNSTVELKEVIASKLKHIDDELASLHARVADEPDMDINEKDGIFKNIDQLEADRDTELEDVLLISRDP